MTSSNGFSLIELLIAVVIVAILTAIALPSYQNYILQSHRTEAINAVLDLASREARYYTTNNSYSASMLTLGYSSDPTPLPNATDHYYDLSISSANGSSFSVQAVPVGNQVSDSCGTYTYSDLGIRGVSSGSLTSCWKQ
ncbi:MAG: type IV pilin protein [Rhodocyclaceae bacterium]|nr:type IV pilin protein [Rhodocyclaceae bacterium]